MARTIEFNREQVVESAMHTFWKKGYSQTSIPNLVSSTKLNPGSIYAAFDSKEGLFLETMEFYGNRSLTTLKQFITEAESPLKGIENFFQVLINKTEDKNDKGCLIVNTLLEMSSHNPIIQQHANMQLKAVETELFNVLEEAKRLGEISSNANPKTLAKYLMVNIWGLRVLAKTGTMNNQTQSKNEVLEQILSAIK
jgi:TetR/AcrR family transcriptional repressor of nem operon